MIEIASYAILALLLIVYGIIKIRADLHARNWGLAGLGLVACGAGVIALALISWATFSFSPYGL